MRKSVVTAIVSASVVAGAGLLTGCEDGPNQSYSPATGDLFNNGASHASNDPATGDYGANFGGRSRQEICTADEKRLRWAEIFKSKIEPPRFYAGIDMAGDDTWRGLSVDEATGPASKGGNCQGTALGGVACPSGAGACAGLYWGDNAEVSFYYNLATRKVDQMVFQLGYTGAIKAGSDDGKHTFEYAIGKLFKDGQQVSLNWADPPTVQAQLTELYNAVMFTYGPKTGIPYVPSKNCKKDRGCLLFPDDGTGTAFFGVRPVAFYAEFHANQPQPLVSQPFTFYNFFVKTEPYGNLPMSLKLDQVGPQAAGVLPKPLPEGGTPHNCSIQIGQTYNDFLTNCVQVTGNSTADQVNLNKLIGGRSHDWQNFFFNVVGVNQNFTDTHLGPTDIILDQDLPHPDDFSTDWYFDVRSKGHSINDQSDPNAPAKAPPTFEATGLVVREYARLVQADINAELAAQGVPANQLHKIGDPACLSATPAAYCTGFEGTIIPNGSWPNDPQLDPGDYSQLADSQGFYGLSVIQPGDPTSTFCLDVSGYSDCYSGPFWDNSLQWVVRVLGRGDINKIPAKVRDRRYFFRWFGVALVKYYRAYGAKAVGLPITQQAVVQPADVQQAAWDPDSIFFDNSFADQFDKVEYIDRASIVTNPPQGQEYLKIPMDFEYGTDPKSGNQRYSNWYRRLDREEAAMFVAMQTNKNDVPGSENNVNLTNLFGSPVLAAAFPTYGCAIGTDKGCSGYPRTRANGYDDVSNDGTQGLRFYPGVWGKTVFSMGHSPIKIAQEKPQILGAVTTIPNFLDPYSACAFKLVDGQGNTTCDPADPKFVAPALSALVLWVPQVPGSGFQIPYNGSQDKTITTATLDFTGVLETYMVDYVKYVDKLKPTCAADSDCNAGFACNSGACQDGTIVIDAIEAHDFLGEVFLCQDPQTGDLLHVPMYDSAARIIDWLAQHPGGGFNPGSGTNYPSAQSVCDIVIRYSPYNNYPDFITSRANGVKLDISRGEGLGRVVDVILYDPSLASQ